MPIGNAGESLYIYVGEHRNDNSASFNAVTPREIEYKYNSHFEDKKITILAYTLETLIAEKFQTVINRDIYNTRMKNFYDIHILMSENKDKINFENLILAIRNTFKKRNTELNLDDIKNQIQVLRKNYNLNNLWSNYQKNAPYSSSIKYDELFDSIEYIINILNND